MTLQHSHNYRACSSTEPRIEPRLRKSCKRTVCKRTLRDNTMHTECRRRAQCMISALHTRNHRSGTPNMGEQHAQHCVCSGPITYPASSLLYSETPSTPHRGICTSICHEMRLHYIFPVKCCIIRFLRKVFHKHFIAGKMLWTYIDRHLTATYVWSNVSHRDKFTIQTPKSATWQPQPTSAPPP